MVLGYSSAISLELKEPVLFSAVVGEADLSVDRDAVAVVAVVLFCEVSSKRLLTAFGNNEDNTTFVRTAAPIILSFLRCTSMENIKNDTAITRNMIAMNTANVIGSCELNVSTKVSLGYTRNLGMQFPAELFASSGFW